MTKIIGITGGIGTGKSTVAEYLKEKGYPVIDADETGRRISRSRETVREIESRFGTEYVGKEGLDRKAVAALIFSDPLKKAEFEKIVTKRILDCVSKEIADYRKRADQTHVFLDAPTLFETGADGMVDEVWLITADEEKRVERAAKRDGCSFEEIMLRMKNQMPEEEKAARADVVIDNSRDRTFLFERLDELLELRR